MAPGGQTTVIQRILERRADRPPTSTEETTASIAVMLRVVPPSKALIACADAALRQQLERIITADALDYESIGNESEALRRFLGEFRPVVLTDSLELVRSLRARSVERTPFIVYFAELDEAAARQMGLSAGADECVGRSASTREIEARIGSARRIAELETVLRITLAENRKLSATDDLTRVASRRFFSKNFPREVERAARYGRGLSLVLCDIDFFKKLNDTHGHAGGDQILRQFAMRLQQNLRRGIDWVARIGGEEFAIVLPETTYEQALEVARKLRTAVAHAPYSYDGKGVAVTASFGLCGLNRVPAGERQLAQRILKIADAALYRSKHGGRNRVTATMFGGHP
ncbi:MAG: diguanylate cyclase [Proteobacteria bacterium]|nr:diguanylate cyclase [Pseudomonadota bacterium]